MLKLAGEFIEGQLADHQALLDAHTKNILEIARTGEYLFNAFAYYAAATQTLTANRLYATPFWVARAMTVDRIAIEVATAGAAGEAARLGIYKDGTNLYPGDLVVDAGTVAVDSTGIKTVTISEALTKGLYWVAVVSDGTPGIRAWPLCCPWLGLKATGFAYPQMGWYVAYTYAALPDPYTSGGSMEVTRALIVSPRLLSLD